MKTDVLVVGAGPAGMMAAIAAAEAGAAATVLEKNEKAGKKLFITGHGRCNVTNAADRDAYEKRIFRNPRFVRSALARFGPQDLMTFLEANGTRTKEEDSGRIFPASDKSSDVIRALTRRMDQFGVTLCLHTQVTAICFGRKDGFLVQTAGDDPDWHARSVILATGGVSYPSTGSTGDGYRFSEKAGHTIVPARGALIGLEAKEDFPAAAGITLGDAQITLFEGEKRAACERGEILFTHSGLSGPAVLRASCLLSGRGRLRALIDLLPAMPEQELDAKLAAAIGKNPNRDIATLLSDGFIPKRLCTFVCAAAQIPAAEKGNQVTRAQRRVLAHTLKALPAALAGTRPVEEAIITAGGVDVREIHPKTMESRLVPGLFFAGELIDVSAYTGGYNLQIAFSTGRAAGTAAAEYVADRKH